MPPRPTLVTGAGGFIGGRLVESLTLDPEADVRAGVRRWASAARVARFGVELVQCDLLAPASLDRAMSGVGVVVHCAYANTRESIVQGTRNALAAARRVGVDRFVFMSTAEVYGPDATGPVDEASPCPPTNREYADAKIEAEKLCWDYAGKGLPVTILRPSIVYGPFGSSWTIGIAQRLASGNWGVFDEYGEGICNAVHVDDLVSAVRLAISHEQAAGHAFNVNGEEEITWNQYFTRFNAALGLPSLRQFSVERSRRTAALRDWVNRGTEPFITRYRRALMRLYLRGGVAQRLMKRVKESLYTNPSRAQLEGLYARRARYVDDKARRILGYRPNVSLETGLRLSALWLRHHRYVPGDHQA